MQCDRNRLAGPPGRRKFFAVGATAAPRPMDAPSGLRIGVGGLPPPTCQRPLRGLSPRSGLVWYQPTMSKGTLYFGYWPNRIYGHSFFCLGLDDLAAAQNSADNYYQFERGPDAIVTAEATASQVAAIRRAEAEDREYDVDYVYPANPKAVSRVKVRASPYVPPRSEPLGTIYHLPDGGRVLRHPDGRLENLTPLGHRG